MYHQRRVLRTKMSHIPLSSAGSICTLLGIHSLVKIINKYRDAWREEKEGKEGKVRGIQLAALGFNFVVPGFCFSTIRHIVVHVYHGRHVRRET